MSRAKIELFALLVASLASLAAAGDSINRGANLLRNPGFEESTGGKPVGWTWDEPAEGQVLAREGRGGGWCVKLSSENPAHSRGISQTIVLGAPTADPMRFSAWSRTTGMEGQFYDMHINVFYADGTSQWANRVHFSRLAGEWSRAEAVFVPEKPVSRVVVKLVIERAMGAVWFDDVDVSLAPHRIDRVTVWGGLTGEGRLEARATSAIPSDWKARILCEGREVFFQEGAGREQRVSWNGLDPQGAPVPRVNCTVVFEATDRIRGERTVERREVSTASPRPGTNYGIWIEDSMVRVLPGDLPGIEQPESSIRLSAARGEAESAQIVVLPAAGAPLRKLRVVASDLMSPDGAKIGAGNITWHQVGYVWLGEHAKGHPFMRRAAPGWWPDPLLPVEHADVDPGWAQPLWITARVPAGTPPGRYVGTVRLRAEGNPDVAVPVEMTVNNFTLPTKSTLRNSFALMHGYLEQVYGPEKVTPKLRQAYGEFMLSHRLNPDDITRTDLPHLEDLEHYNSRGLGIFNVLNLAEPRKGAWNCFSPVAFYTPRFRQALVDKLDPYVADLKARGLADKAYVYAFDERGEEYRAVIREYFGLIKERYNLHTLTTAKIPQDPKVMRALNVDWLCPLSDTYSFADAERCRREGLQVWMYVCLGPRFPYANFLADDPLVEARSIMWQAYHQKIDGFLYWGVNVWWHRNTSAPIDPSKGAKLEWGITTKGMDFLHGDGVLIYPLADGPAGSIRLANIRDGMEDYEYLWALGKARGDPWSTRKDCEAVTTSLTAFTRDPAVIREAREKIARELSNSR